MDALQSLAGEHRLILRTLEAFEVYVGYVEAGTSVDRFDLQRFVAFFQDFADLNHHDKEEALLFPALVEAGLDWTADPLARLRREHDQGHYLMQSLEHSAMQGEAWSEDERQHFLGIAKEFIAFQRGQNRTFSLCERSKQKRTVGVAFGAGYCGFEIPYISGFYLNGMRQGPQRGPLC